ncbi:hypothetical protein HanRHA438_Chr11g0502981 [Helianthus annuus]|uniref:Uncharacterized protein n=1 Tax=Helianthus annuus TaxID=4232 RepID=A0A9K3HPH8_HELAN|nr:hypothetical protein HanXRQr2_Chr11g0490261 [Helianthus annuus]KAJ0509343.1 hypothetical protein HanIR_Chr11g0527761 [Helianthus annuus]KAJ0870662.1 hypothetical protein HanRHA438_Chr11g0502981 [Helianthus annuus]KAJ0875121.1 hypothetical protein HanPSC8_Chr11g0472431 [Helianthus annuus]
MSYAYVSHGLPFCCTFKFGRPCRTTGSVNIDIIIIIFFHSQGKPRQKFNVNTLEHNTKLYAKK